MADWLLQRITHHGRWEVRCVQCQHYAWPYPWEDWDPCPHCYGWWTWPTEGNAVAQRLKPADQATWLKHTHLVLSIVWLAMVPIALVTGWISSLIFISACSIYANAASHLSAWQASRAETNGDDE